jgi:hypothetical protein
VACNHLKPSCADGEAMKRQSEIGELLISVDLSSRECNEKHCNKLCDASGLIDLPIIGRICSKTDMAL